MQTNLARVRFWFLKKSHRHVFFWALPAAELLVWSMNVQGNQIKSSKENSLCMLSTKRVSHWLKQMKGRKRWGQFHTTYFDMHFGSKTTKKSQDKQKEICLEAREQRLKWRKALNSGQFSFCGTLALISFLILHLPLPLLPAPEICPPAITSQSRPLPGFLCFAKANQCCSKATLL